MIDFAPHNATFVAKIFPSLPDELQHTFVKQLQRGLERDDGLQDLRLVTAYRALRGIDPSLSKVEGTDPTQLFEGSATFSKILDQANSGMNALSEHVGNRKSLSDESSYVNLLGWGGISHDDMKQLGELLDQVADRISEDSIRYLTQARSTRGFGLLAYASRVGRTDLVQQILDQGADPDSPAPDGCTPLHEAVIYKKIDCATILIKHGANLEARLRLLDSVSHTCLTVAVKSDQPEMAKLLLKSGADPWHRLIDDLQNTAAHLCAHFGPCLSSLLTHNPRLAMALNAHGRSPLHYAAGSGNLGGVQSLHRAGGSLSLPDINGSTPLHMARMNAVDFAYLFENYCSNRVPSRTLQAVIKTQAMLKALPDHDFSRCVTYLVSNGANDTAKDREGSTPSQFAYLMTLVLLEINTGEGLASAHVGLSNVRSTPWMNSFVLR